MSLPSRDELISTSNGSEFEFLFNISDGMLPESSMFFELNETIDFLDFISPVDSSGARDFGDDDPEAGAGYLDQQELNGILKEFRNNLFSYTDTKTIVLICLYVPIFGTALVGNMLVLMVVLPNRHMRNVTNCFIVNLAVADLLVTLICMPMAIGQSVHKLWIYGEFMCKMTTYMQGVSVSASVFTLMVLSVDRFLAIRHPMTFRSFSASRYAVSILTCLWILATATMVPLMLVRQIHTINLAHHVEPLHFCTEIWKYAHGRRIYDTFLFVFMFIMPGCFITASYSLIGCKLWTEKEQIHRRDSQAGREQTEKVMAGRRRVARMLAALAIVFACCWLPYHLHNLYLDFTKLHAVAAIEALPFTILLGHANSAFNPILYCFMNKNFRKATARLLHIKTKRRKKKGKKDPVNVVVRYQVTNTTRPVSNKLVQRPLLRAGSSSSVTATRSTGSSRITRTTPNSFRTGLPPSRRSESLNGTLYSHLPVSDKILQNEVFPSKPLTFRQTKCAHDAQESAAKEVCYGREPTRAKREMFDFTLSIPTTIQEESSRGARSASPNAEKRPAFFNDPNVVQFEEQRQLPAKVVTSVLKEQSDRYKDTGYEDADEELDQIDIEIHVSSEDVPVITCEEIE